MLMNSKKVDYQFQNLNYYNTYKARKVITWFQGTTKPQQSLNRTPQNPYVLKTLNKADGAKPQKNIVMLYILIIYRNNLLSNPQVMRKLIFLSILLLAVPSYQWGAVLHFALGLTLREIMSEDFPELTSLLSDYKYPFLSGLIYPDTGYWPGCEYGEMFHESALYKQYAAHLCTNCKITSPLDLKGLTVHCKELYAHFYGTYMHAIIDQPFNWEFESVIAEHDNVLLLYYLILLIVF
eukprot:TRINITY_DN5545_c0_g1_i3.p2 TRINITY_DN5545_c0_g1~~TRINITY_DN5545_c0_g1_i3.p2  ORF type:complete len:237 (-),score=1.82 TRINITY_DN5545_c0_g1_i3:916-1626(-)